MKRQELTIALALIALAITAHNAFGQAIISPRTFATYYGFKDGIVTPDTDNDYYWEVSLDDDSRFGAYEGKLYVIDSAKEWFLTMACGTSQIKVTDASMARKIESVLPSNDPKKRDLQAGALVFQDIQVLRFLGDTAAVSRHEAMLKWITDRKNATRQEIEAFYRDNVRALIAGAVDDGFNKISFLLNNATTNSIRGHNSVLTRNPQTGQYTLSYGGAYTNNETRVIIANSLDTLLAEMRNGKYKTDFDETGINAVKAQAALIPAAALSEAALNEIKTILTNFYITPNAATYACVKEIHIVLMDVLLSTKNVRYGEAYHAYERALAALNEGLAQKVLADVRATSAITTLNRDQQQRMVELRR